MVKPQELTNNYHYRRIKKNSNLPDPFWIIYNHRRVIRAKALKKLKDERLKFERNNLLAQR